MSLPAHLDGQRREFKLDYVARKWQAYCHRHFKRFNVLAVHRRAGKSALAVQELIEGARLCTKELPMFGYIAPTRQQAKTNIWDRLKKKLQPMIEAGVVEVSESELFVRFLWNDAKIKLFGAKDPDSIRGSHFDGVVMDEVAQMEPVVWEEVVRPMIADRMGWVIFIGTPKGINLFSAVYTDHEDDPEWFVRKWTCYETEALPPDEIERIRENSSTASFAREMLCDFNASSDDQLISLSLAVEASRRVFKIDDPIIRAAPVILGVDPARSITGDRAVIFRRQGMVAFEPLVFRGIDNMTLAARVAVQIQEHRPAAVFIDSGGGAGVIDRLRQLGHSVIEVPFGGSPLTAGFLNRRMEMWWRMKEWLEQGGGIPNRPDLIRELSTPTYGFNKKDLKVMESKDDIKSRLPEEYGSPDEADALALCFAAPVAVRHDMFDEALTPQHRQDRRYHPFAADRRARRIG